MTLEVLIAGEGKTELGRWALAAAHREAPQTRGDSQDVGLIEALVRRRGAIVASAMLWKSIRKFRAGHHAGHETRNVLGLALVAKEHGHTLVFLRDRDGDGDREAQIVEGIRRAQKEFPAVSIVGGCAVESIEAFGLWALGDARAEQRRDPKAELHRRGHEGVRALVELVSGADLSRLPPDSAAGTWFRRLDVVLGQPTRTTDD
ncbi:MAG: hypothetical protein K1X94_21520 [Sandaracinaceae bacterium]|nr:hypothetical protein [Sandaracinaceae bacterium]